MEVCAEGTAICLGNINGRLSGLDNECPHRGGPLGEGWVEGESVVCPWHSWTFSLKTGEAEFPVGQRVRVYEVKAVGEEILVDLE